MNSCIRPLSYIESLYTYYQQDDILIKSGYIGNVKGAYFDNYEEMTSSWNAYTCEPNGFTDDLDNLICSMKESDGIIPIMSQFNDLTYWCHNHPELRFEYDSSKYGFRIDTEEYSYLVKIIPEKGEYSFNCYCYVKELLDNHLKEAAKGIEIIRPDNTTFKIPDGSDVCVINQDGYKQYSLCRYLDNDRMFIGNGPGALVNIREYSQQLKESNRDIQPSSFDRNLPRVLLSLQ